MEKNLLVKFHSRGFTRDRIGLWLTDEEGYNTLLSLIDEYQESDYEKYPYVFKDVTYTPAGLRDGISTCVIDENLAKFIFPYCAIIGENVLTMFISWFTFEKGVLRNERARKQNKE